MEEHAPEIDFRVSLHSAQSESLYTVMLFGLSCHRYECTIRGHAIRYLHTLLRASQNRFLGLLILLEYSLSANKRSGLSKRGN